MSHESRSYTWMVFSLLLILETGTDTVIRGETGTGNRRLLLHPDQPPPSPGSPPIAGEWGLRPNEPVPPPHLGGVPAMEPTSPPIAGIYGQDCTPASGDFPDKCPVVGQTRNSNLGKIQCIHNHDCCTCGKMICGSLAKPTCTDIICNGDSACFGVKWIEMHGDPVMGARLDCNGDVSCMKTQIKGYNINHMGCTGDFSCAYSRFALECLPEFGCLLACVGDDSCKGHPTDPTQRGQFDVTHSFGMKCSHDSCRDATFNLIKNVGGGIWCGAEASCTHSTITADNIGSAMCNGEFSCYESFFLFTNPQEGFELACAGFASCKGLTIEILVTDPEIEHFRGIICNSASACQDIQVTINKVVTPTALAAGGSRDLYLEELSCGARLSCLDAKFDLGENIIIEGCGCAGGLTRACDGIIGVNNCVAGLGKLECIGKSCRGITETITNPLNDFEIICNDLNSCVDFNLMIVLDGTKPTHNFKGIKCGSPGACRNMRITIANYDGANRIAAGDVQCTSANACTNVHLEYYNADVGTIFCDGASCSGCMFAVDGICHLCAQPRAPCPPLPVIASPATPANVVNVNPAVPRV